MIKSKIFLLFFSCFSSLFCLSTNSTYANLPPSSIHQNITDQIFDLRSAPQLENESLNNRQIDPEQLRALAKALNISPDQDLIQETQKQWLRKPNQERWEQKELPAYQREYVFNWAQKNGILDEWRPMSQSYDKALILGATTSRMEKRLDYLKNLWNQGIRFHEIVWLTGERPLDPKIDTLTDQCQTESEAAIIIWKTADLPPEMRQVPVIFIAAPMKHEEGGSKRPNTDDTIQAWIKQDPIPCHALFISDQPFCGYQFSVIKKSIPTGYQIDLAGEGASLKNSSVSASTLLDSIARWIYNE